MMRANLAIFMSKRLLVRTVVTGWLVTLLGLWGIPTSFSTSMGLIAQAMGPTNIAKVWANEGGDKVTRDELRATANPSSVFNSVWNGTTISLFGARNEVVAFNLVLEVPTTTATNVNVSLTSLAGPGGASLTTTSASRSEERRVGKECRL